MPCITSARKSCRGAPPGGAACTSARTGEKRGACTPTSSYCGAVMHAACPQLKEVQGVADHLGCVQEQHTSPLAVAHHAWHSMQRRINMPLLLPFLAAHPQGSDNSSRASGAFCAPGNSSASVSTCACGAAAAACSSCPNMSYLASSARSCVDGGARGGRACAAAGRARGREAASCNCTRMTQQLRIMVPNP